MCVVWIGGREAEIEKSIVLGTREENQKLLRGEEEEKEEET